MCALDIKNENHLKMIVYGRHGSHTRIIPYRAASHPSLKKIIGMPSITRIDTGDPRMSKVVVHNGVVYLSGQTDTTADDSKYD